MISVTGNLQDIPRIYTAFAEWLSVMLILAHTEHKVNGWKLAAGSALFLGIQSVFLILTDHQQNILWILCMIIAVLMMYLFITATIECTHGAAVFYCAGAFILAEFMAAFEWMINVYALMSGSPELLTNILTFVLTYGLLGGFMLWLAHFLFPKKKTLVVTVNEAWVALLIGVVIFIMSNLSYVITNTPLSGTAYTIFQLRAIIDLGGVAIIYAYQIQVMNLKISQDMVKLEAILQTQYQQYNQSKEVQDNINFKYHDLKQYITIMRQSVPQEQQAQILDKIETEINDYEIQNKTGNQILDTLLSAKSITCQNQGILLTTVINGGLLSFMETIDICSIFGNALDNAIEYEKTIPNQDKRMINLNVFDRNGAFLVIRCENYYEGYAGMNLKDKLPKTTKQNTSLHGYGLRSIQHAVHKYGGEMDIGVKDNWFCLKILIPLPLGEPLGGPLGGPLRDGG